MAVLLRLLRFCVLGSGAEPGHGRAIFGSCNPRSSADRKNKVLVMGLYFRGVEIQFHCRQIEFVENGWQIPYDMNTLITYLKV